MNLENMYLKIIHKVPSYFHSQNKMSKRKIQEIMRKNEYDEKYIENISDDFCQGFGVAKQIILELMSQEIEKTT